MNLKGQCTITRMLLLSRRLHQKLPITKQYVVDTFGVSLATAKRDLYRLEQCLPVLVTQIQGGPKTLSLGALDD